MLHSLTLQN